MCPTMGATTYGWQQLLLEFKATFTPYRIAFRSDAKNTYPYLLGTLFSEELLQLRDVVSLDSNIP
jgi:hypothetical protein